MSRIKSVNDLAALRAYLEAMDVSDDQDSLTLDHSATAAALRKLKEHPEPEARIMRITGGKVPAYNVQTAVDAEHAIMMAQAVTTEATDNRSLQPMAQKAQEALGVTTLSIVADAGYSNGE